MNNHGAPAGSRNYAVAGTLSALALAIGAWASMTPPPPPEIVSDPIFSREVVAYEMLPVPEGQEGTVKYEYLGDPLPGKLAPDEEVTLRTETSYTKVITPPTKDTPGTYEGVFYFGPTFARDGDVWRYIEHATTTETAFNLHRKENMLASLFWKKAHAASISPFSTAGDGYSGNYEFASEEGFAACRPLNLWPIAQGSATGQDTNYTDTNGSVYAITTYNYDSEIDFCDGSVDIYRGFYPFDTSAIPAAATISSASLNVYVTGKYNDDNDGTDFITVVQTSQSTHTSLSDADYDQAGAIDNPTEGVDVGQRKDITSITTSAYLSFTLNATGISWIKKNGESSNCTATAGISCFGLREGHDALDSRVADNASSGINTWQSEQTGTSQDPYLSVTYTGGATNAFWQFQDF